MAARKIKGTKTAPWPEIVRERIRGAMLEKALMEHVLGKADMKPSQVQAGLGLLKKILPDLTENDVKVSGDLTVNIIQHGQRRPPE